MCTSSTIIFHSQVCFLSIALQTNCNMTLHNVRFSPFTLVINSGQRHDSVDINVPCLSPELLGCMLGDHLFGAVGTGIFH